MLGDTDLSDLYLFDFGY